MSNFRASRRWTAKMLRALIRWPIRVHRDQRGAIGIASVFALLLLVMLLGLVMNSSRQVGRKVKMQNAADAATYSGGVVIARSLNTLAFTNHLLSDVFALTAFMREARDRSAESLTPEILDHWRRIGPHLATSEFPKFADLGAAINEKVPLEADLVSSYSEWAAAASELMLPVLEEILAERMIPEFQRALVLNTPRLAQQVTDEVARRHGEVWPRPTRLHGVLWRTNGDPVGGMSEAELRTLPVVDPVQDMVAEQDAYIDAARAQRRRFAKRYLREWNDESLEALDVHGKMSQFSNLWRIFTCGQLEKLLEEDYPVTNLPHQIRQTPKQMDQVNATLERDYMFVGVVYQEGLQEHMPAVFRDPVPFDAQAYAQVFVFVPRRRLIKTYYYTGGGTGRGRPGSRQGGLPGQIIPLPSAPRPTLPGDPSDERQLHWAVVRQSSRWYPEGWHLMNQNWTVQLAPATASRLPEILSAVPDVNGASDVDPPSFENLTEYDIPWLSHH